MAIVRWDDFERGESLSRIFGTRPFLDVEDGFFLALDDYLNRRSGLPCVLLPTTIVQFFRVHFSNAYKDISAFYRLTGEDIDPLDWMKLKHGASLAYFFAVVCYAHETRPRLKKVNDLYDAWIAGRIQPHLHYYLSNMLLAAQQEGVRVNLFNLFTFSIEMLKASHPTLHLPKDFKDITSFLRSGYAAPYTRRLIGEAYEENLQHSFESEEASEVLAYISRHTGDDGILIPIDEDKPTRQYIHRHTRQCKVPDYLFITKKAIHPIDLKVALDHAREDQVSRKNLLIILSSCSERFLPVFRDSTVRM